MKRIIFTVTTDLSYDQRMQRICQTLAEAGYEVLLVGRKKRKSLALGEKPYRQHRLFCFAQKGKWFYIEYNIRLFFLLLFSRCQAICSIDLDTLLACSTASRLRNKPLAFDAHEYFTELPELVNRPRTQRIWRWIEQKGLPQAQVCYTVGMELARIFTEKHKKRFYCIRNVPFAAKTALPANPFPKEKYRLLYQGALNEGRGLEACIAALHELPENVELWLAGEGDLSDALRKQAEGLGERLRFWGYVQPAKLKELTKQADIGLNLLENKGLNYYYSLANKFFDYMQAERPSLNPDFPEYRNICTQDEVGLLLPQCDAPSIVAAVKRLTEDPAFYAELQANCREAKAKYTWEQESEYLLRLYETWLAKPKEVKKKD